MVYPILKRANEALDPAETQDRLVRVLGDGVLTQTRDEFGSFTVRVATGDWLRTLEALRDDDQLAYDMFDCLFGVDRGEDGFDMVAILYSTSKGRRILVTTRCDGGREAPTCPSAVDLYRGANFMEREAWDMFGIEFDGHPGVAPRLLCVENFEGWPLRKDFFLVSREVKPWPGIKEPAELDEDGNVIEKTIGPGEAPGPSGLDELMAEQAKRANAPEVEAGDDAASASEAAPKREEVAMDQALYDELIAEGKSERVARSKAKRAAMKAGGSAKPATSEEPTAVPATEEEVASASEQAEATGAVAAADAAAPATSFPVNDDGDQFDQATYDEQIAKGKPERVAMSKAKRAAAKMDAPAPAAADPQATGQAEAAAEPTAASEPDQPSGSAASGDGDDSGSSITGMSESQQPSSTDDARDGDDSGSPITAHDEDGNPYDKATYDEQIAAGKPERVALSKAKRAYKKGGTTAGQAAETADAARQSQADARAAKAEERAAATTAATDDAPSIPAGEPLESDATETEEPEPPSAGAEVSVAEDENGNEYDKVTYESEIERGKPERVAMSKAKRALAKHRKDA